MRAAILGGGLIGAGWAELLRSHGHAALVYDSEPALCQGAGRAEEALEGADLVLEAVAERLEVKQPLLQLAGRLARPGALIASSSSSILPTLLQEGVEEPGRVLVIHPLHPVTLLPVIEVVPGRRTALEAVERARQLVLSLGKQPVVLRREVQGYVVNRLAAALWREALNLVSLGVVDVKTLDLAASRGPCLGWAVQGPFLTYDLAAREGFGAFMAHLAPAFASIWRDLARWESIGPDQVAHLTEAVALAYGHHSRQDLESERDRRLAAVFEAIQETEASL